MASDDTTFKANCQRNRTCSRGASNTMRLNPWRLEPIDLRRFMRLGVEHIYHGAVDRRRGCLPFATFNLTDPPACAKHDYWGSPHIAGRFCDALAVTSDIVDVPADHEVIDGLRKLLHDSLDNPSELPFDSFPWPPDDKRTALMHNCREVLLGLLGLWQWQGCEHSEVLARKLVRTIEKMTCQSDAFPSWILHEDGWAKPEPDKLNYTTGRLIGALVAYYRVTEDEMAIDLAKRFAEMNIRETFTAEGRLTTAAGMHLHSTEGTMASLLDLGVLLGDERYLQIGKQIYDVGLVPWRTSYGWAKEMTEEKDASKSNRGEANNTGDFIEAALRLGQAGYPQYYSDAERFIRNGLLASQVVETDWIPQSDLADEKDVVYSNIRQRAKGAFAFTTPNGYHSYNTDLVGGSLQSLSQAYRQIVTNDALGVHVNMHFHCDSPWLTLRCHMPEEGRLEIHMLEEASLYVRLSDDLNRQDVMLQVNGKHQTAEWKASELFVGRLSPADAVVVMFPLHKRQTQEATPEHGTFDIDWIGDTIVGMTPMQGNISLY